MKIAQVSYLDRTGGAFQATNRIHQALRQSGVDSRMYVVRASAGDWTVEACPSRWGRGGDHLRARFGMVLSKTLRTENRNLQSVGYLPSRWPRLLNRSDTDVFHLHWIGNEMMSVADVARLRGPVVWTLHDMWAFCGAEHYAEDFRWRDGYSKNNREEGESGFDLNRWVWRRKMKHWRQPINIVAPSMWMADCARQSMIMRDWPITVIPNAIDTDVWRPVEKICARTILGLPADRPLLLFGANGGTDDARKGFDLLRSALQLLHSRIKGLELVVLGQPSPKAPLELGLPVHFAGHLHDEVSLRLYYSAADTFVLPSRQDNLPNVGLEAEACGTPVVAFRVGGMPDIVDHKTTGYLAEAFDVQDLACGIKWVLDGAERRMDLSARSRQTAVTRFCYSSIARRHIELYESVLQSRPDAE